MQAFSFYIAYGFIYVIASLPFRLLYLVSDLLYYLLRLSGYRKEVVINNLKNSFPEKTPKEINQLCENYFRYLCDLILETFKTLKMNEDESAKRCVFVGNEWLERFQKEGRSIILVLGHYGNWEWAGPGFQLKSGFPLNVIYRPLSHPYFEKMMVRMRTRFNTRITPVNLTLRDMVAHRNEQTAIAFIADQSAPKEAHWMNFLHQDTAVFTGPEKLAIKFDFPVVYLNITRPRRGYYEISFELITAEPRKTAENEISEKFMKRLEAEILKNPTPWLWSHKRWKHKRTVTSE
jgi:KDO2-lipid IV(A) lauroyltransferase